MKPTLPPLPEPCAMFVMHTGQSAAFFSADKMLALQAATVEACAQVLLEAGFKSTGVPAYEFLADKLRGLK